MGLLYKLMKGGEMENNKKSAYTKAIWYLIVTTITLMLINVFSLARYSSNTGSNMNLIIAKPIVEIDSQTNELTEVDSNEQEIVFSVRNYDNGITSDIAMNYQIKFETTDNFPMSYTLYKVDGENRTLCGMVSGDTSEYFYMPHSEATIEHYVVSVKMDDVDYQGQSTQMKIVINARQVI